MSTIAIAPRAAAPSTRSGLALAPLAALMSYGALLATWLSAFVPLLMALPWWGLGVFARRRLQGEVALRTVVALANAYAATLVGMLLVRLPNDPGGMRGPYAFGEHPVLQRAGFPWPGVEGNGLGMAVERIPFAMGVDALLVNLTAFALLFAWLSRRSSAAASRARVLPACVFAAVASALGGVQLLAWFD